MVRSDAEEASLEKQVAALRKEVQDIKDLPMKTLKWLGGLIVGAVVAVLTQNFLLHQETAQTANKVAQAAVVVAQSSQATSQAVNALVVKQQGTTP